MLQLIEYIEYFLESGIDVFVENEQLAPVLITAQRTELHNIATTNTSVITPHKLKSMSPKEKARMFADSAHSLTELENAVRNFDGCLLKNGAQNTVFARGAKNAQVMFIGEAPGRQEDAEGIPFCGQSGKLLDNIIRSIGIKPEDVYITNTVFWRPPANRRPTPEEIEVCRPFVERHVQLINPRVIVLVGSTAVEALLANQLSMHAIRNQSYEYTNQYLKGASIPTSVIFHPSYLLRQPYKKKLMWFDMYRLSQILSL